MAKPDYQTIKQHYEKQFEIHGDSHLGVDWPNAEDAITRYRVMSEIIRTGERCSLMDFGCGLSHFYEYLTEQSKLVDYVGVDISQQFVDASQSKYPNNQYLCVDILKEPSALPRVDYAIANGVFTEKLDMEFEDMWAFVQKMLVILFDSVDQGIACNFMSKDVDWERDDLFHLPLSTLSKFVTAKLSRSYVIRNDYGLYEYTIYVMKD